MADTRQGISVEGLSLLLRNLRKLDSEHGKAAKKIHEEVAEPVASLAKSKARKKSGKMASTIRPYATQSAARVGAGARTKYTGVQHYGWPGHGISPNMFLTESINDLQPQIANDYERRLGQWIEQIWQDSF